MKRLLWGIVFFGSLWLVPGTFAAAQIPVSEATETCLDCHATIHPGIVADWKQSRHAQTTPKAALAAKPLARKVSAQSIPENLLNQAVGCAECHTLRPKAHADTFDHDEFKVHVVVSPKDCATCHPVEADQYSQNIMSHAWGNLANNSLYAQLQRAIIGTPEVLPTGLNFKPASPATQAETCYYCHGTRLEFKGLQTRETDLGEMDFPVIDGWPNQGVGRINLDNSRGSCAACHTRHSFSIEMARKPYTCKECHVGPDVPAFKVYASSKHGNIFSTMKQKWDFKAVPWTVGQDFTAPTCATCHISLLVDSDGEVVAERTHQMNTRLPWRIFGLPYAHAHPINPDTTTIRNKSGLPLPTDLDGTPAARFLIDAATRAERQETLQAICLQCHDQSWVQGHWRRFEKTLQETNNDTLLATQTMQRIWSQGFAQGLASKANPFDEAVERRWLDTWLLYANTTRFASAMAGGGDYGVYADGRYHLRKRMVELEEWLRLQVKLKAAHAPSSSKSKTK